MGRFKIILENLKTLRSFSLNRWRYLFWQMSEREKMKVAWLLVLAAALSFSLAGYEYWVRRHPAPAVGGRLVEGIVGEPRFLNSVLGTTNEVDRDLTTLLFAGLTKHNPEGRVVGDLAESFEVLERGRIYEFNLREGLFWPDGEPITSDDVIFTINVIQNPEYQSPLRSSWQGVRAEKLDERRIRLTLNLPYQPFLENTTVGILPQHFWQAIQPQNFALAELNIKPIGAGPYVLKKIVKGSQGSIRSLELKLNESYHGSAFVENIVIKFFAGENELFEAWRKGDIDAMGLFSARTAARVEESGNAVLNTVEIPRYFAVFFNRVRTGNALNELAVRRALAHATPRERIVNEILAGKARIQEGPLPPWYLAEDAEYSRYEFDLERARTILENAGWKDADGDGTREKAKKPLEFTLTTTDWPDLTQTASILQETWGEIGVRVNLDVIPVAAILEQVIRPRDYDILLFGEVLGANPDPFSFWHSSQVDDVGLNLSGYESSRVDTLLVEARQNVNESERNKRYFEFQQIITRDLPAIFLYSPNYLYVLPKDIKGFTARIVGTPSHRFENINDWYIKTKRVK